MTRKRRRLMIVVLGGLVLATAAALVLTAFEDNIVFFHSPTDIATDKELSIDRRLRIGGLVKPETWKKAADGLTHNFAVTDMTHEVKVAYKGYAGPIPRRSGRRSRGPAAAGWQFPRRRSAGKR